MAPAISDAAAAMLTAGLANPKDNIGTRPMVLVVASSIFLTFTWLAFSLRMYCRAYLTRSLGADDWLMAITLLIYTTGNACLIRMSILQMNKTSPEMWLDRSILSYTLVYFAMYIMTMLFLKLSLAVFFLRIVIKKWQRRVIIATIVLYSLFAVMYFIVAEFQCGNPAHFLANRIADHCLDFPKVVGPLGYAHSTLNAISDWIFAILPIFVLRLSQLTTRARISVLVLIFLAVIGSICSVARVAYIKDLGPASDYFFHTIRINTWSVIETGLGITAASLATLRPMFRCLGERARTMMLTSRRTRPDSPGPFKSGMMVVREVGLEHACRGPHPSFDMESNRVTMTISANTTDYEKRELPELEVMQQTYNNMHSVRKQSRSYRPNRPNRPASIDSLSDAKSFDRCSLTKTPSTRSADTETSTSALLKEKRARSPARAPYTTTPLRIVNPFQSKSSAQPRAYTPVSPIDADEDPEASRALPRSKFSPSDPVTPLSAIEQVEEILPIPPRVPSEPHTLSTVPPIMESATPTRRSLSPTTARSISPAFRSISPSANPMSPTMDTALNGRFAVSSNNMARMRHMQ